MGYTIKGHILHLDGKPVAQRETPNKSGAMAPTLLVMHYTVTGTAKSAIDTLCSAARGASAHLVLGRDGAVTQLVPFNRIAWHAGKSAWPRKPNGRGCNAFSVGLEMVNWGWLHKRGDGKFVSDGAGAVVPPSEVIIKPHKDGIGGELPWQAYPAAQMQAAEEIARAISAAYGLRDIVGHEDICLPVGRKRDPGPAFDVDRFADRVFGRADAPVKDAKPAYFDALHLNDEGPRVKKLQTALGAKGLSVKVDSAFGPATRDAVVKFQKSIGVDASGAVGPFTWRALGLA